jgi:hypothetical protein
MEGGVDAKVEAGVGGCVSPRPQRREERKERPRGRGPMVVAVAVLPTEYTEGGDRSGLVKSEAEQRHRPRPLFACVSPLDEAGVCVSNDFDWGGVDGNDHMPIMMLFESEWPTAEWKEYWGRTVCRNDVRRLVSRRRQQKCFGGYIASWITSSSLWGQSCCSERLGSLLFGSVFAIRKHLSYAIFVV